MEDDMVCHSYDRSDISFDKFVGLNDAFCQCIGLSFRYDDAMGLTDAEWNDIWNSSKELPGIVSMMSTNEDH